MLFFMHIPKTAGTSFRLFLERSVRLCGGQPAPTVGQYPSYASFVSHGAARSWQYDLVSGHYPYHVRELLPPGTPVVTVLRDPLERCLSHIKHQIAHEARTGEGSGVRDLNEFIELPRNRFFLDTLRNVCVKYLAYRGDPATPLADDALSLDFALRNARRCKVGFTDELDRFVARIGRELTASTAETATPESAVFANSSEDTRTTEALSPQNRERLRAINQLDLRLYDALRDDSPGG